MAASATSRQSAEERRKQVVLGDLSPDFLRVMASPTQHQIDLDLQTAQFLQAQQSGFSMFATPNMARLSITIVAAKLAKNYGLTKMDPYCRIRIGHSVFETQTAVSGAKNPRWNKTVYCYLPAGVDTIYLEIYDERAFTMDDRVAWTHIQIPQKVLTSSETSDDWYLLNGKQGDGKEGMVNLVLSYSAPQAPAQVPMVYAPGVVQGVPPPVVLGPGQVPVYYPQQQGGPIPVIASQQMPAQPTQQLPPQQQQQQQQQLQQQQQQAPANQGPPFTEADVKLVKDMFPNVDEEVITSVLEMNRGDKDLTINHLLQMNT